jgi:hypothetical protein
LFSIFVLGFSQNDKQTLKLQHMVRISYNLEGRMFTEVISARRQKVSSEMLDSIDNVYVFKRERTLTGQLAKRFIKKLQRKVSK